MGTAASRLITLQEIEQITADEGERWGYPHVRRVLALAVPRVAEMDHWLAYIEAEGLGWL